MMLGRKEVRNKQEDTMVSSTDWHVGLCMPKSGRRSGREDNENDDNAYSHKDMKRLLTDDECRGEEWSGGDHDIYILLLVVLLSFVLFAGL